MPLASNRGTGAEGNSLRWPALAWSASDETILRMACRLARKAAAEPVPILWSARCWCAMGKLSAPAIINLPAAITPKSSRSRKPAQGQRARHSISLWNHAVTKAARRHVPRALIRAGIKEVVAGTKDPNPLVAGRGFSSLRRAGIKVRVGVLEDECRALIEAFAKFITRRMPFVTLKLAASLDGKIATASGDARWISGDQSRARVHRLRNEVDAVLVGAAP